MAQPARGATARRGKTPPTKPVNGAQGANLKRGSDLPIDRRLPDDLKKVAEELISLPAAERARRRQSTRRTQLVALKPYIVQAFEEKGYTVSALAKILSEKKTLKVSRRYLSDFLGLWTGSVTPNGLRRVVPELFDKPLTESKLREILKGYGADEQTTAIGKILKVALRDT